MKLAKNFIIIFLILSIACGIGGGAYHLLSGKNQESKNEKKEDNSFSIQELSEKLAIPISNLIGLDLKSNDIEVLKKIYNMNETEHYIILGVFNCKEDFLLIENKMKHYYKNIHMQNKNGRLLMYLGAFDNKKSAMNELVQLKLLSINGVITTEL